MNKETLNKIKYLAGMAAHLPADVTLEDEDAALKALHGELAADTVLELIALAERTTSPVATTPSTASQAPAVSIDTPEFLDLACKFAHESSCEEFNEVEYNSARAALVAHINAKLEQTRAEGFEEMRQAMAESAKLMANACRRATAAEAKLEAIRQGAEGLQEYSPAFKVIGGMAKSNDGGWLCKEELRALLQPQHQADESGFPG